MPFNHNGIVMVDLEGRITFANTFFCDLMGTTANKVSGLSCFDFVFTEDLMTAKILLEANKLPNPKPFTFKLKHIENESAVLVNIQGAPLATASGEV